MRSLQQRSVWQWSSHRRRNIYVFFLKIIKVPLLRVKGIARVCEGDPRVTGDLYAPDPDHQACCRLCVWLIAWAIDPWVFKFYSSYFL